MPNEPSMEEILSSIKRIIADEDRAQARMPRRGAPASASRIATVDEDSEDPVLELTEVLLEESEDMEEEDVPEMPAARSMARNAKPARSARPRDNGTEPAPLTAAVLSDMSAKAARDSLENLSKMIVRGSEAGESNTLEGLVRELLKPMLKEWLDLNLPIIVETLVKREIDRITGRV